LSPPWWLGTTGLGGSYLGHYGEGETSVKDAAYWRLSQEWWEEAVTVTSVTAFAESHHRKR